MRLFALWFLVVHYVALNSRLRFAFVCGCACATDCVIVYTGEHNNI